MSGTASSASYVQFVEMGALYSSGNDFAAAETALAGALDIDTNLGPDSAPVGLALMDLRSGKQSGRFDEADGLFVGRLPSSSLDERRSRAASILSERSMLPTSATSGKRRLCAKRRLIAGAESSGQRTGDDRGLLWAATISSGELAHSLRIEAEMPCNSTTSPRRRQRKRPLDHKPRTRAASVGGAPMCSPSMGK